MNTPQNPAQAASPPGAAERVQPDCPLSGEVKRGGAAIDWRPISELPDFDHRPIRQFIWIEGERDHSGRSWAREHWGLASICREDRPDSRLGYSEADIQRLAQEGDMHWLSVVVTHWAPASINTPRAPRLLNQIWRAVDVLGAPDTACTSEEDRAYSRAIGDACAAIGRFGGGYDPTIA